MIQVPAALRTLDVADGRRRTDLCAPARKSARTRLVLSHGNGLAIDGYLPFWGPLCEHYDLMLFDFRHHGRNPSKPEWAHGWPVLIRDMEQIRQAIDNSFGKKPTAGVFHSMSAVCAILHTLEQGPRWDLLALFDPPFYARDGHPLQSANRRPSMTSRRGPAAAGRVTTAPKNLPANCAPFQLSGFGYLRLMS